MGIRRPTFVALLAGLSGGCTPGHPDVGAGNPDAGASLEGGATVATELPPPISGGTLLVTRDGLHAVASDVDTGRVSIVGISDHTPGCSDCGSSPRLLASVQLPRGEEPGRLAEDGAGRVQVVLRQGGAIGTIDLPRGELLARRPVCPEPRGIAYAADTDLLHVACASGELVSLSPSTGVVARRIAIDVDLRDVVVVPGALVVSRFKTAELVRVDHDGHVAARLAATGIERGALDPSKPPNEPMDPAVAWRTVGAADGSVFMLHQYGLARPIELGSPGAAAAPMPYAVKPGVRCGGIVVPAVSTLSVAGTLQKGMPLPAQSLSVDLAVSADAAWVAVAHAGAKTDRVSIYSASELPTLGRSPVGCAEQAGRVIVEGQPVAVAIVPGRVPSAASDADWLIVQTRAPAEVSFYRSFSAARVTIELGGSSKRDLGHDLFHVDSGGGIACAQCHPEGAEDGRVWMFSPLGPRRTQALNVGLEGTEPFHWSGNLPTLNALIDEVFVRRMGGLLPTPSASTSLEDWLLSIRAPRAVVDPRDPAAQRGRVLFESKELGCKTCHDGPAVTKNTGEDVGVASPDRFQIPALRGVGYRAPFLHLGCAPTLRARFTESCGGGDRHGTTSQLSSAELDDLVRYLQSL